MSKILVFKVGSGKHHILRYHPDRPNIWACSRFQKIIVLGTGRIVVHTHGGIKRNTEPRWISTDELKKLSEQNLVCQICIRQSEIYQNEQDPPQLITPDCARTLGINPYGDKASWSIVISHNTNEECPICGENNEICSLTSGNGVVKACLNCLRSALDVAEHTPPRMSVTITKQHKTSPSQV